MDINGKESRTSALIDHKALPQAPTFYLQDIDCRRSYGNLIEFIRDTFRFHEQQSQLAKSRADQWRPFITPMRSTRKEEPVEDPIRHTIPLDSYTSLLPGQDTMKNDSESYRDEAAADADAMEAVNAIAYRGIVGQRYRQNTVKDTFNDDVALQKGKQDTANNTTSYHPTLLLSHFSFSPSQSQSFTTLSGPSEAKAITTDNPLGNEAMLNYQTAQHNNLFFSKICSQHSVEPFQH